MEMETRARAVLAYAFMKHGHYKMEACRRAQTSLENLHKHFSHLRYVSVLIGEAANAPIHNILGDEIPPPPKESESERQYTYEELSGIRVRRGERVENSLNSLLDNSLFFSPDGETATEEEIAGFIAAHPGGFSIVPRIGKDRKFHAPMEGIAVTCQYSELKLDPTEFDVKAGDLSPAGIMKVMRWRRTFSEPLRYSNSVLGGWHDEETHEINISALIPEAQRELAIAFSAANNQKQAYVLSTGESVETGGTNEHPPLL